MNNIALGITVAFSFMSSVVGTTGELGEYGAKSLNWKDHPRLKTITDAFVKSVQTAAAAFTLLLVGSLSTNPIVLGSAITAGIVLVLTPSVHAWMKGKEDSVVKRGVEMADQMADISAKVINTAMLTVGAFMALGPIGGALVGAGSSILSFETHRKEYNPAERTMKFEDGLLVGS